MNRPANDPQWHDWRSLPNCKREGPHSRVPSFFLRISGRYVAAYNAPCLPARRRVRAKEPHNLVTNALPRCGHNVEQRDRRTQANSRCTARQARRRPAILVTGADQHDQRPSYSGEELEVRGREPPSYSGNSCAVASGWASRVPAGAVATAVPPLLVFVGVVTRLPPPSRFPIRVRRHEPVVCEIIRRR